MEGLKFTCFKIECGWLAIMSSSDGLLRTTFPLPDEMSAIDAVTQGVNASRAETEFIEVKQVFTHYFKGEKTEFRFPLDLELEGCTQFQKDVWEAASRIPYGILRSYGWLAAEVGRPRAARAVGQALGANRLPIVVPCHRIVRSDGTLGGFSGGLHWKVELIKMEKALLVP